MRFTRRTYKAAIRRSIRLECIAYNDHIRAFRGIDAWVKQVGHTKAISLRQVRETWLR